MKTANIPVRLTLVGAGNVGRRFLELVLRKGEILRDRLGLNLVLVGIADSGGAAVSPFGLDLGQVIRIKEAGQSVAALPKWGRPELDSPAMVQSTTADLLIDASPANMQNGQPGLACIEIALQKGMHVVTANKAPLVLAFPRLQELTQVFGGSLRFDATVAGGLPAVNLGRREMAAAEIHRLEGVLNLTTNYILTRMAQDGLSYQEALRDAQEAGHAETDPTLDVEGWDAANKLVILSHSVLGYPATLDDVQVEGIVGITPEVLAQATGEGKRVKLLAVAEREDQGYRLSVRPTRLEPGHPMVQLGPKQMGIVYHTDIHGIVAASIVEETPIPTAAAVLRDVIDVYR
jgi:homoserine dehydrogenase